MTHLLNLLCSSTLVYAAVTRGGLGFAWVLGRVVNKPS
jgi:hypothetical protein